MSDFESWESGPKHAAPPEVAKKYAKRDDRFDTFWITVKMLLILAGAAVLVWWTLRGK